MFAKDSLHFMFTQTFLSHKLLDQKSSLQIKAKKLSPFSTKPSAHVNILCPFMFPFCLGRQHVQSLSLLPLLRQYTSSM